MNPSLKSAHLLAPMLGVLGLPLFCSCSEEPAAPPVAQQELLLDTAGKRVIERKQLPAGTPAPDFRLLDQDGQTVTVADLRDSVTAIGFIYTHCPDVCGLLTASFLDIGQQFKDSIDEGDLRLVLITTDPERDTPERIKTFTNAHGGMWTFLTGDLPTCEEVWKDYGVTRKVNTSASYVYHTYKILLIDRDGNLRYDFVGLDDPEADLVRDIKDLLGEI